MVPDPLPSGPRRGRIEDAPDDLRALDRDPRRRLAVGEERRGDPALRPARGKGRVEEPGDRLMVEMGCRPDHDLACGLGLTQDNFAANV